jgi:hypothetical protein
MTEPACLDDQKNDVIMALEVAQRLGFILAHEPLAATDVCGQDSREPPEAPGTSHRLYFSGSPALRRSSR